jgi:hypothetical protein
VLFEDIQLIITKSDGKMKTASQKVSFGEKVGYSLGDGSANLVFQMN